MELVRKRLSLQFFLEDKLELVEQQKRKLREKLANICRPCYVLDALDVDDGSGSSENELAGSGRDRRRGVEGILRAARAARALLFKPNV